MNKSQIISIYSKNLARNTGNKFILFKFKGRKKYQSNPFFQRRGCCEGYYGSKCLGLYLFGLGRELSELNFKATLIFCISEKLSITKLMNPKHP